jgi:guanylate kinase
MDQKSYSLEGYRTEPLLIVISGPAGVGKDSAVQALMKRNLPLHFVVTATSRPPRPNEVNGVDYIFVSEEEFQRMIAAGELLEHAEVYRQSKGIPRRQVEQALASGKDVILRVDVQGAATIRKLVPEAVLIFLSPANEQELRERLMARKSETPEGVEYRLEIARKELEYLPEFDYLVINAQGCLEQAVDALVCIINAEHHRVHQRKVRL